MVDWEEILHILVSVITIALAFSLFKSEVFDPYYFFLVLVTVGSAFILHEMAHKYVAIHYGAHATYRAWTIGLFLALVMAFITKGGFVFAAPGAVYIFGNVTRKQNGIISLAGPLTNLALAALFFIVLLFAPGLQELAMTGVAVNLFLGAFNMIPIYPMDGSKVLAWNQTVWLGVFGVFAVLLLGFGIF